MTESAKLREDSVRELAGRYGVPTNASKFAADGQQAAALGVDRPVAIKLVSDHVVHKSKAGGVLLDVDPADIARCTEEMLDRFRRDGAEVTGVTVEPMIESGTEVVIGALRDPGFGPVVMFGTGGVDVETVGDIAFALAPLDKDSAAELIGRSTVGRVIERHMPDRIDDLVDALLAVAGEDGLLLNEAVTDVDLNPIVVTSASIVAVDARARQLAQAGNAAMSPALPAAYDRLKPAIYPSSVAVIGASQDPRKMGNRAVRTLVDFGYEGEIIPVGRNARTVCDIPTVAGISKLPAGIDRAIVALPAAAVPSALDELAEAQVRSAHVLTADTEHLRAPHRAQMPVLGPNCIGHYTPYGPMTMIAPDASSRERGGIAVVSQSGTYAGDLVRRGHQTGLRFSFVSSVGNCDDVSPSELLAFCAADPATNVIGFYLEDDNDASAFFRLAATIDKPVVLFKGGRTAAGSSAAASHTGALASDPRLLADVAQQSGTVLVDDLDDFIDMLLCLQDVGEVRGDGLALVGSGGGVAVVGSDAADRSGLTLPELTEQTHERLQRFDAPGVSLTNPIDIPIWSLFDDNGAFTGSIVEATAQDKGVDAICAYLDLGTVFDMLEASEAARVIRTLVDDIIAADRSGVALALVLRTDLSAEQETLVRALRPAAAAAGIAILDSVNRAITALGRTRRMSRLGRFAQPHA